MILCICMFLIFVSGGAFLNRVRGGLRIPKTNKRFPFCKIWQPIVYGFVMGYMLYKSELDIGVSYYMFGIFNGLSMYLGQQICGWGDYIGEATTGKRTDRKENELIDNIIKNIDSPRVYGYCGLALRGLLWTVLLGYPLYNIPLMLSGLLMPICYLIADLIKQSNDTDQGKNSWNLGEWIFGGYLWGVIYLCIKYYMFGGVIW